MTVFGLNILNKEHLQEVIEEMKLLGAPTLRVVECGDFYQAIEGSHRLEACKILGIIPELIILEEHDLVETITLDLEDLQNEEIVEAWEIAAYLVDTTTRKDYQF